MSDASRIGKVVASKYRLDAELGRGGMGAVYRAFHVRVHKDFAIKLLHGEAAEQKSIASRFFLEAQAAGRIGHPGILDVYDVGEDDGGTPFIVMELLRGEALASLLRRRESAPLDVGAACWIASEVLDILEAAHAAGVVHRDVKPQNVFLVHAKSGERSVKLLDFGIAKFAEKDASLITKSGEIIGSPLYMAPEQARGEPDLDARADVWSVGAMLFEMLTGAPAHAASTPVAVLAKILTERAPTPSSRDGRVPPELDAIVTRALAIDRAERFPDAATMRDALRDARASLGDRGVPSLPLPEARASDPSPSGSGSPRSGAAAQPGVLTSTIEAPSGPGNSPAAQQSQEPALAAAMTNGAEQRSRTRPIAVGLAIGALAVAAIVPWLVPGWTQRSAPRDVPQGAAASAPEAPSAHASVNESAPEPRAASPSASALTTSTIRQGPASPGDAGSTMSSEAAPSAKRAGEADRKPTGESPASVSKPACPSGEVLSSGHCCARGLVWQSGRCERPIATSF